MLSERINELYKNEQLLFIDFLLYVVFDVSIQINNLKYGQ